MHLGSVPRDHLMHRAALSGVPPYATLAGHDGLPEGLLDHAQALTRGTSCLEALTGVLKGFPSCPAWSR